MKVTKNNEHNSIEISFDGVKPSEGLRTLMKAYGFWWFGKGKVWCHSLEVDAPFFENFVEERIKPLAGAPAKTSDPAAVDVEAMSEADKQALLARLMGK